ncbi:MAG: NnrU family protein [Pseudomonadota bacterium]
MTLLILGLLLWSSAHLFKRLAPDARARMGDPGKAVVAVASLAAIVLMVIGYRAADVVVLWSSPPFLTRVNNLLMILAIYLFVSSGAKTWITTKIRHPQLTAVKTWAVAHLLVNGDLASLVLFGGLLVWAVVSVIVINRASGDWVPEHGWPVKNEVQAVIGTVVVLAVIGFIHNWLGYWPFG